MFHTRLWWGLTGPPPDSECPYDTDAPSRAGEMRKTTFWAILLVLALAALANCDEPPPASGGPPNAGTPDDAPALSRRILFFSAGWCAPCRSVKGDLKHPERTPTAPCVQLRRAGWKIGPDASNHIQTIDADRSPGLCRRYQVQVLPTFVLIDAGREVRRVEGIADARELAALYRDEDSRLVQRE